MSFSVIASPYQVPIDFSASPMVQYLSAAFLATCVVATVIIALRPGLFSRESRLRMTVVALPATLIFGATVQLWSNDLPTLRCFIYITAYLCSFLLWAVLLSLSTRKQWLYTIVTAVIGAIEGLEIFFKERLFQEGYVTNLHRHYDLPMAHVFIVCWSWILLGRTFSSPRHKAIAYLPIIPVLLFVISGVHLCFERNHRWPGTHSLLTVALCIIMVAFAARDLLRINSPVTRFGGTVLLSMSIALVAHVFIPVFLNVYDLPDEWLKCITPYLLFTPTLIWITYEKILASRKGWEP
jgi:hypothetical protein